MYVLLLEVFQPDWFFFSVPLLALVAFGSASTMCQTVASIETLSVKTVLRKVIWTKSILFTTTVVVPLHLCTCGKLSIVVANNNLQLK